MDNQQCNELKNIQYKSMLLSKKSTTPELISKTNNNIDIEAYSDIRPKLWSVSLTYKLGKKNDIEN